MKLITSTLLIALLLSSCSKECHTCKREIARTSDKPFPGYPVASTTYFDATKEEAEAFNHSYKITRDTINGVILTTNDKITCYE